MTTISNIKIDDIKFQNLMKNIWLSVFNTVNANQ